MAITTLRFDLTWENDNAIQLTRKEDEEASVLIGKFEENGDISAISSFITGTFMDAFSKAVKRACDEMLI